MFSSASNDTVEMALVLISAHERWFESILLVMMESHAEMNR